MKTCKPSKTSSLVFFFWQSFLPFINENKMSFRMASRLPLHRLGAVSSSQVRRPSRVWIGAVRRSSSKGKEGGGGASGKPEYVDGFGKEGSVSTEVLTPGEKVKAASRLGMWTGAAVLASFCAYYIGRELFPTRMSPNSIMSSSWELVRNDHNVSLKYGEDLKCYGTDRGGSREGRRNFVESTNYVSKDDGSNRCRIRYNIEGGGGRNFGFVFAEVSDKMNAGEFVYILVQDRRTGGTMTILDNRAAIRAGLYGQEGGGGMDALAKLLGGGK